MTTVTNQMTKEFFDALYGAMKSIDPAAKDVSLEADDPGFLCGRVYNNKSFLQLGEEAIEIKIDIEQEKAHIGFGDYFFTVYETPVINMKDYLSTTDFFNALADRIVTSTMAQFKSSDVLKKMSCLKSKDNELHMVII